MKPFFTFTLLACCLPVQAFAETSSEIPLGIEAVTGIRSEYIYRGFTFAEDSVLDFQIEGEIALNDHTFINIGGWYAAETGDGDFDETGLFTNLRFQKSEDFTFGLKATYRDFSNSVFESGIDLGAFGSWHITRDFNITAGAYYDFGAEAWYTNLEGDWSKPISEKSYISFKTGISYVNDYYDRDGINDVYARLSLTSHISDTVSVTPFIGASILIDDDSSISEISDDDSIHGGFLFVVRF